MHCTNCGIQLPEDAKFCSACGKPVTSVEQPPSPQVAATPVPSPIPSVPSSMPTKQSPNCFVVGCLSIIGVLIIAGVIATLSKPTTNTSTNTTSPKTNNANNDDQGTPVSYSAVVFQEPNPTLSFHWLSQAQNWADNNTPDTKEAADLLASQYGKYIPSGTDVQVVAESPNTTSGNGLANDTKFCEIQLPGGDERVWMQCFYLKKL